MRYTKKYFRKKYAKKKYYKTKNKRNKGSKKRKVKKSKKSKYYKKRFSLKGGGDFPYVPQGIANTWWGTQHNVGKLMNNWQGVPTGPSPSVTDQPRLLESSYPTQFTIPDLQAFNYQADANVSQNLN